MGSEEGSMSRDYVWVVHGDAFAEACEMSINTVLKTDPGGNIKVYTDKLYPNLGKYQEVIQGYHDKPFMLMNVLCQFAHLADANPGRNVLFLDADLLLTKQFPVNRTGYGLTVTWRKDMGDLSNLMPYNYGVLGAKKRPSTVAAFAWMASHITRQGEKQQKWYGNQVALRELVGAPQDKKKTWITHPWFDIDVHYLPCDIYNYTPKSLNEDISEKTAIHCKGDRKDMLKHYYDRIMAS